MPERIDIACLKVIKTELGQNFDLVIALEPEGADIAFAIAS